MILSALSPVPDEVGSGTGTFTAFVFVGPLGQGGHKSYPGQLIARSTSLFLLP